MKIATFGWLIIELAWEKFPTGSFFTPFSRSLDRKLDTLVGGKKKVDKGDGHAERDAQSVRLFAEG